MSKKVLITGAGGQLGIDLVNHFKNSGFHVYGLNREELDFTNQDKVKEIFAKIKPDLVIHSGAYTAVDQAEVEVEKAYLVNGIGTRNIAVEANNYKSKLVYVSTDYVFNGKSNVPVNEFTNVDPIGIYGQSKLAGENFVRTFSDKFFIVRTSWVFGLHGNNFVKTMITLGKERAELGVVNDQFGCPTYSVDLAEIIHQLVETEKFGVYHASNSGSCSWFEFAEEIFNICGIDVKVNPINSEDFPRPAKRPEYSVFDHMGLRLNHFRTPRHWKEALYSFLIEADEIID
ncbi:dTDP-4-dehydrorhamnose reductase [Alkalicoccobacillus gibsonii]|uniref:dTDP-4-dehydrorhamnose reductase n=1 Tax=Alkalicoccobacillus gibsonii TaxID=79881 RepID=UPI00351333EA